jgi:hypothetical protein
MVLQLPYYTAWMNSLRCGLYAIHAWVSLCLVVLMFTVEASRLDHAETTNGAVFWEFQNYNTAKLITNVRHSTYLVLSAFWFWNS